MIRCAIFLEHLIWETGEKHPTGPALKLLNLVSEKGLGVLLA